MDKLLLIPEQANYVVQPDNSVITVLLDGGYSRSRIDLVNSAARIQCSWRLKDGDYQYIRAFYHSATKKGVIPFLLDIVLDQPYLEEYEVKFVPDTFEASDPQGLTYEVQAELEVIPVNDEEFLDSIVEVYDPDGEYNFDLLEKLVNVDINGIG